MHVTRFLPRFVVAALVMLTASCSDSSGPTGGETKRSDGPQHRPARGEQSAAVQPGGQLLRQTRREPGGPHLLRRYQGKAGEEYLRFRVDAPSLLARPDGTLFQEGDSILIHVVVGDPAQLLFDLQPSGLRFSPAAPARLTIHYDHADDDFNKDGRLDKADDSIETTLGIWRQETPNDPFVRLGSAVVKDLKEIEADIQGFSRYALAY